MSEQEKTSEGADVLPYRSGNDDAPVRLKFSLMLCGGIAIASGAVALCGAIWVMNNIYLLPPPLPPNRRLNWELPLVSTIFIVLLLAGIAFWARRVHNRGLLLGLLIGFGVTVLIEGLCFTMS